ncbi:MAG: type VI secretion system-associated protein TagF [Methyloprofundus sp.]|nr:type VI secretion system-associated protein TagF [Methyloprofundus sp.]
MSAESIIDGYYGKVSTRGDFVSRGLPVSFINPWDSWLQEAILSSQQQLGKNWLNCYLTGPIYRFSLASGICGEQSWLGIMMPSVDSIGRYYPMTIVVQNYLHTNPFTALQEATEWFVRAEELALSSLSEEFDLQLFNQQLAELKIEVFSQNDNTQVPAPPLAQHGASQAWQSRLSVGQDISHVLPRFMDNLLKENCFSYSVWWTAGSEQVSASLLVCEGLPPFDGIASMLDGNWNSWGWEANRYALSPTNRSF